MAAKKYPKPPKKLSDLIALALGDLMKVERSKKTYRVNMCHWHFPSDATGKCNVCFAGSVMAKTLGAKPSQWLDWKQNFTPAWWDAFEALNDARVGLFQNKIPQREVTEYADSPKQFKADMRQAIKELRAVGK